MEMSPVHICIAFTLGIASHLLYFIRGEHHNSAPVLASLVPTSWIILLSVFIRTETMLESSKLSSALLSSFALGLYSSIITYRLFFHPLKNFPGPFFAKISKLWHVYKIIGFKNHFLMEELHQKYGDIVRIGKSVNLKWGKIKILTSIGPNEVVVFTAEGVPAIHGLNFRCTKAPFYEMLQKDRSVSATRNVQAHRARRRVWSQGFGPKALKNHEKVVNKYVELLLGNITRSGSRPVNATQILSFFGFDVMGEAAFGEGFGMLETNKEHPVVKIMKKGIIIIGRLTPVPWLVVLLSALPAGTRDFARLEAYSQEKVLKRIEVGTDESDVGLILLL